jgi:hypothetical protein
MRGVFITCNTDAGYFPIDKVGSFAYWIKGGDMHLHGSGLFKTKCAGPWQAEMQAIINALHVLKKQNPPPIIGFIFNTDNLNARPGSKGNELRRKLKALIQEFKDDAKKRLGKIAFTLATKNSNQYAQFRHVEAHTHTDTKRNYVNDWCDKQCKARLREWLAEHKKNKHLAI